jgi:phosphoribosylamine--glycine ligase
MKILILGAGGREHAIGWKLSESHHHPQLLFAPGNAGTQALGQSLDLNPKDVPAVVAAAQTYAVDLVIVGPEAPLVAGVGDALRAAGFDVVGPNRAAAQLEGSKAFAKSFMQEFGIPTADYRLIRRDNEAEARAWLAERTQGIVLKADGLAAGKGVFVCRTPQEALAALDQLWTENRLGTAADVVVAEELLVGPELSIIVAVNGPNYRILPPAKDYKRAYDGDLGPNTGGMGAVSPVPDYDTLELSLIESRFVEPSVKGLVSRNLDFRGFLYLGLLRSRKGIRLLEYNVRLGDPETQVLLPRIETDFVDFCRAIARGGLSGMRLEIRIDAVVGVVLTAEGYPGSFQTGMVIMGLDQAQALDHTHIFHSGTRLDGEQVVTAGGRVLTVCASGTRIEDARRKAYQAASLIHFEHKSLRTDIADGL